MQQPESLYIKNTFIPENNAIPAFFSKHQNLYESIKDITDGLKNRHIWWSMAVSDLKRRYRRTVLGPFWTTLSLAIYIGSLSVLFTYLWKTDLKNFLPYFSAGYICWMFISALIMDGCSNLIAAEALLKQISLPYSMFSWFIVARNFLILLHHTVVYALVMITMQVPINMSIFLLIPALLIWTIMGFWIALAMGMVCARFRDLQQVVTSFLQVAMFMTPIFWSPSQLSGIRATVFVNVNPLYHFIEILRAPLLGNYPSLVSWVVVSVITFLMGLLTFTLFVYKRKKLIFWL